MDLQKCVLFLYLSTLIILSAVAQSEDHPYFGCGQRGNYTENSIYLRNLNTVLSSLPSKLNKYGFCNVSTGKNPNRVNAVAVCRGDVVDSDICRSCIQDAVRLTLQSCPNQIEAFGGYDKCKIRYTNVPILGYWSSSIPTAFLWNVYNASNQDEFKQDVRKLLEGLRDRAANGSPLLKFAAGNISGTDSETIYAAVQCSPDLAAQGCSDCLVSIIEELPQCPCYATIKAPSPKPVIASPPQKSGKNGNTVRTIIIIAVLVVAIVILLSLCVCIVLKKRQKRMPENNDMDEVVDNTTVDEISIVESLQYNFAWRQWREGTALNLVDPFLRGNSGSVPEMMRCIHMALLCVQENVADRPTMSTVVLVLSSSSLSLPMPSAPAFFMHSAISPEAPLLLNEAAAYSSQNEASITELHPR
nr:putative receptor-like protein kinase At4g00960 [Ipomoea batatas]